ncbi:MAG TPA: glycosyltransferase family 2 protein [Mobilitalea sp.]|nr:glycosyltransferase family 2 protein [Mobilitalea sp.]
MKLLSVIIPCYNSQDYMRHCIESLLPGGDKVELLIIDDGSTDNTADIAEEYANTYPAFVKAIHQKNCGHGGAINTGLRHAKGLYLKVVDSDDWVDGNAYLKILKALHELILRNDRTDMLVSNFVYEKEGAHRLSVMHYDNVFPINRMCTWDDIGDFRKGQYILMHSVIYRTQLLRDCSLELPEHTFYVDNLFVYLPLAYVNTIYYIDVNFYRYYIGRDDQSVNEKVMIGRIDQQIKVNRLMLERMDLRSISNYNKRKYMFNYLEIVTIVSSILLIRSGTKENLDKKNELWRFIKVKDRRLYRRLREGIMGLTINLPGRTGRMISVAAYKISRKVVGFN